MTEDELVVMDGKVEIAREGVSYEYRYGGMVWSLDGRHVSLISAGDLDAGPSSRELVTVDTRTSTVRRFNCSYCHSLAPVGGDSLIVTRNGEDSLALEGLLRFDLGSDEPPVSLMSEELELLSFVDMRVFAGSKDYVLAIGMNRDGDSFFTIRADGSAQQIEFDQSLPVLHQIDVVDQRSLMRGVGDVRPAYTTDGNIYFAATSSIRPSLHSCSGSYAVFIVGPETGEVVETDISSLHPVDRTPAVNGYARVLDLWWANNGQLHAVMLSGSCDVLSDYAPTPPSVWRLVQGVWEKVEDRTDKIIAMRHLSEGTRLVIVGNEGEDLPSGDLYMEQGDSRELLGTDVLKIEVPNFRQCDPSGEDDAVCKVVQDMDYGASSASPPLGDVPETPSTVASSPSDALPCRESDFLPYVEYNYSSDVFEVHCREGLARVEAFGPNASFSGRVDILFRETEDGWSMISGGINTDGTFSEDEIIGMGLDVAEVRRIFPEMEISTERY
ncbi:hypothetical protein [Nocardiopsis changdeensis]|uniref:hypothetical protein n=1 Tax=Nocardiopsis changdeensis TaxID=2831969 RepID=UPI003F450E45